MGISSLEPDVLETVNNQKDIAKIKTDLLYSYSQLIKISKKPDYKNLGAFDSEHAAFSALVFDFASIMFAHLEDKKSQIKKVAYRTVEIQKYSNKLIEKICEQKFTVDETKGDLFAVLYSDLKNYVIEPDTFEEMSTNFGGMSFSKKDQESCKSNSGEQTFKDIKKLKAYIEILEDTGKDFKSDEAILWISTQMNCSEKKIRDLMEISKTSVESISYQNSDGEEVMKTDTLEFSELQKNLSENDISLFFIKIQNVFTGLQERTQNYISALITQFILSEVLKAEKEKHNISFQLIFDSIKAYPFVEQNILYNWYEKSTLPTQGQIAQQFGKDKTDASRTLKNFLKKIRE